MNTKLMAHIHQTTQQCLFFFFFLEYQPADPESHFILSGQIEYNYC